MCSKKLSDQTLKHKVAQIYKNAQKVATTLFTK